MPHKNFLTEEEQKQLYLVHHMHHLKSSKTAKHELHHCFLYTRKNMRGERYQIKHLVSSGKLYHILNKEFSGTLYDHLDNKLIIKSVKIKGKNYSIIK
ncbi:MAG: hypothetical protein HY764_02190 [Candidatus Portnoybacteria bacterium]|nr:hypothetical protein [Candidatus Portnoybacteria bacterium]